jgi:hypothetical protein
MFAAALTVEYTKTKKVLPIPVTAPVACIPYESELDQEGRATGSSSAFVHESAETQSR